MTWNRSNRSVRPPRADPDRPPTLADLAAQTAAQIVAVSQSAPPEVRTRLRHLGFRPGTKVVKLRTAPLGDPAVYRLLGYDTCLRRHEAAYLEVSEEVSEEVAAAVPEEIGEQP